MLLSIISSDNKRLKACALASLFLKAKSRLALSKKYDVGPTVPVLMQKTI